MQKSAYYLPENNAEPATKPAKKTMQTKPPATLNKLK